MGSEVDSTNYRCERGQMHFVIRSLRHVGRWSGSHVTENIIVFNGNGTASPTASKDLLVTGVARFGATPTADV